MFEENDYEFWCVSFERQDGSVIFRKDADQNEIGRILSEGKNPNGDRYIKLWREFQTDSKPHHWVVWAYSKSKGWGTRLSSNL
jgi:hypothetical protein